MQKLNKYEIYSLNEFKLFRNRQIKINSYQLYQWNLGEGKYGNLIELRKQQLLRRKQIYKDYIEYEINKQISDIKQLLKLNPNRKTRIILFNRMKEINEKRKLINIYANKIQFIQKKRKQIGFTEKEKWLILLRANFKCEICKSEYNLHCHHIIPKSIDITLVHDWRHNGTAICGNCHTDKHKNNMQLIKSVKRRIKRITRNMQQWRNKLNDKDEVKKSLEIINDEKENKKKSKKKKYVSLSKSIISQIGEYRFIQRIQKF